MLIGPLTYQSSIRLERFYSDTVAHTSTVGRIVLDAHSMTVNNCKDGTGEENDLDIEAQS